MNSRDLNFPPTYPVRVDQLPGHVRDEFAEVHFGENTFADNDELTIRRRMDGIVLEIVNASPGTNQVTIYLNPDSFGGETTYIETKGKRKKVKRANINGRVWLYEKFRLEHIHDAGTHDDLRPAAVSGFVILSN